MDTRCPLIESQRIVDHAVAALAGEGTKVGVLLPHPQQVEEKHAEWVRRGEQRFVAAHASPYSNENDRFETAAQELCGGGADLVVMHCMGYDESMRARVADVTKKPVMLARRVVASAVAQLL